MLAPSLANSATISDLLKRSSELDDVSDTSRLDVEVLLSYVLGKDRSFLYAWSDQQLSDQQQHRFDALFARRLHGEPVAHLTELREFWSLPFKVSPATLIPRPETELLVERALLLPLTEQSSVLDLGTGTGAIALALASENPNGKLQQWMSCSMRYNLLKKTVNSLALKMCRFIRATGFPA